MGSDKDKENSSSEERLENIKQEETEDTTEYYAKVIRKRILTKNLSSVNRFLL